MPQDNFVSRIANVVKNLKIHRPIPLSYAVYGEKTPKIRNLIPFRCLSLEIRDTGYDSRSFWGLGWTKEQKTAIVHIYFVLAKKMMRGMTKSRNNENR